MSRLFFSLITQVSLGNLQESSNGASKKAEKMKPVGHSDYHAGIVSFILVLIMPRDATKYILKE